jgi:hypothetical protein
MKGQTMGIVKNIGFDEFPKQGKYLGKKVFVCFHYDTSKTVDGRIVRDDVEEPWIVIIALEDGRYILSTECMYSIT